MRFRSSVLTALVFGLSLTACTEARDIVELPVNGVTVRVEIADDPEERQRGLMHRSELAPDAGMLFVFPDDAPRSFWMKNTEIPLSIAYVLNDGTIVEIYDMEPGSLAPVRSTQPVRYALEVNQGFFQEAEIAVGDRIDLRPVVNR